MEQNEMSKDYLIALLVAIREQAKEHEETVTVDYIDKILEEVRKK